MGSLLDKARESGVITVCIAGARIEPMGAGGVIVGLLEFFAMHCRAFFAR
jgi:hypothetical protein